MGARTAVVTMVLLLPCLATAADDVVAYLSPAQKKAALAHLDSMRIGNHLDSALAVADRLIGQARAEPDSSFLVRLLVQKGRVLGRMGLEPQSEPELREAIALAQALGDSVSHCRALRQYAAAVGNQGRSEEALELFRRLRDVARGYGNGSMEGYALLGISRQHYKLGRADSTLIEAQQAVEVFTQIGYTYGVARALAMVGTAQNRVGAYQDALSSFREASRLGREHDLRVVTIDAENSLGVLEYYLGDPSAGLEHFRTAYTLMTESGTIPHVALTVVRNIAICLTQLGRFDEAYQMFEELLVLSRQGNYRDMLAGIPLDQADVRRAQGRLPDAVRLVRAALAHEEWLRLRDRIRARIKLAQCLVERDSTEEALGVLYEALSILETTPDNELEILLHQELGEALQHAQDHRDALHHLLHAEETAGRAGQPMPQMAALSFAARAARCLGRADSALAMLQRAAVLWDSARTVPLDPEWREARGAAGSSIYASLAALLLTHPPGASPAARIAAAYDAIQPFKARTLMERMLGPGRGAESVVLPKAVTLHEVQQEVLEPGELLLDAFLGDEEGFLFAVTRDTCRVVSLPAYEELERKLTLYSQILSRPPQQDAPLDPELLHDVGAFLGHQLLGEAADLVTACSRILVSPDGVLNSLPLAALGWPPREHASEAPAPETTLGALREIVRVPSATYLAWQRRAIAPAAGAQGAGILAVAAPESRKGATLHWARSEVRALADLLRDVDEWTIGQDSLVLVELLPRYRILHFAAHSEVDDQYPWRSAILLHPPGGLENPRAEGIAGLRLPARLVVLSSCGTAGGRILSGEGVQGLTSAFLSAGVPAVVATLWDVADRSTSVLMQSFYRNLADGLTPAAALQAGQGLLRADAATRHPYFWAGFVLVGDPDDRVPLTRRSLIERHTPATALLALAAALAAAAYVRWRRGRSGRA